MIINKQLQKVKKHYEALKEYKDFIEKTLFADLGHLLK